MQRKTETRGQSRGQIVCADRLAGITKCPPQAANRFDTPVLQHIYLYAASRGMHAAAVDNSSAIQVLEMQLKEKQQALDRVTDALLSTDRPVETFVKRAAALEADLVELKSQLEKLRTEQALSGGDHITDPTDDERPFITEVATYLYVATEEAREKRAALHTRLNRLVETIWVWPYRAALVKFKGDEDRHIVHLMPKRKERANSDHFITKEQSWELSALTPPAPRRKSL